MILAYCFVSRQYVTCGEMHGLLGTEACMFRKLLQDDVRMELVPWVMKAIGGEQWRGGACEGTPMIS
jgi:hypothetical protein